METKSKAKFKVGDQIEWSSQSGGYSKKKRGEVIAVLGGGDSIKIALEFRFGKGHGIPKSAVKAQDRATADRYLIKVQPPAKKRPGAKRGYTTPVYYAPLVSTIDGKSKSAGRAQK